jgi:hypothetical protein
MTAADAAAVQVARDSRAEQGLPERVEDPATLAQAARLLTRPTRSGR